MWGFEHVVCNGDSNNGSPYFNSKLAHHHLHNKSDCFWSHTHLEKKKKKLRRLFCKTISVAFWAFLQNSMSLFEAQHCLHRLQTLFPCHAMAGLHVYSNSPPFLFCFRTIFIWSDSIVFVLATTQSVFFFF